MVCGVRTLNALVPAATAEPLAFYSTAATIIPEVVDADRAGSQS
jgi:hypothetical protein